MNSISYSLFKNESLLSILVLIFIIFLFCLLLKKLLPPFTYKRPQVDIVEYVPASSRTAYTKKDLFWILLLTGIYAVVSLYDLGHTKMPSTTWQPSSNEQQIIFELTNETDFDEVIAFYCEGDNNSNPNTYQLGIQDISISGSNDLTVWDNIVNYTDGSIYSYKITKGDYNYRYIKLECTNQNDTLTEIAFKKKDADYLLPVSIYEDNFNESSYPATLLIDEQDKVVLHPTYLDQSYFDEVYHPRNANEIADGQYMYASVHPLLGTSLIALSIKLLGNNPLAWRLPGAIFGILLVPLFYMLIKELFQRRNSAILGTILLDVEFMHLTTSRIATLEPFSVFFIILMFYYMIRYVNTHFYDTATKYRFSLLARCGISMGLGIATKWTACYSAVGLAILFFAHLYHEYKIYKKNYLDIPSYKAEAIRTILWCFIVFIFIPVIIYFVSYIPTKVWRDGYSISNVIKQIQYMYHYHVNLIATHPYQSTWWQWLFDIRPIWYYFGTDANGLTHTISCFTNPVITWVGFFATLYTFYAAFKKKSKVAFIISVGYLSALLPWVSLVQRCVFAYHYYPTSFFMLLAIVYMSSKLVSANKKYAKYIKIFVALSVFVFILFLPVIAGHGTSLSYIHMLEWFGSWYFG